MKVDEKAGSWLLRVNRKTLGSQDDRVRCDSLDGIELSHHGAPEPLEPFRQEPERTQARTSGKSANVYFCIYAATPPCSSREKPVNDLHSCIHNISEKRPKFYVVTSEYDGPG